VAFVCDSVLVLVLFRKIIQFVAGEIGRYDLPFFHTVSPNESETSTTQTETVRETDELALTRFGLGDVWVTGATWEDKLEWLRTRQSTEILAVQRRFWP
jgi:hypothetical protein